MARAFVFALENYEEMKGEAYNVGSNDMNFSKEGICNLIQEKVDYYLHFADVGHDIDQRDYEVSYDKLAKLGFKPTISIKEGIDELVEACEVVDIKNPYYNV